MFYYGLDFHDLAPNFILNISAFIVVCEAFLYIQPHFGLWLKTFNVKPKVVGWMQRKGSHTTMNAEMLRMKFGARSWKSRLSRPICDPIQKELEGPTKDGPAY